MKKCIDHIVMVGAALLLSLPPTPAMADVLYVSNFSNSTIETFTSGGMGVLFSSSGLSLPEGLAFDSAGNLYAANLGSNTIEKYVGSVGSVFTSNGLNSPRGLAFDAAGNLYAANSGDSTIRKYSPTGTSLGVFASTGLNGPAGMAFDLAGNLYVANLNSSTIEKFSRTGTDLGHFASTGLNGPIGLAFDTSGNLYAANNGNDTIEIFTSSGAGSLFANTNVGAAEGLAFDSAGNLYVANQQNKIEKYSSVGADLGAFAISGLSNPQFIAFTSDMGVPLLLPAAYYPGDFDRDGHVDAADIPVAEQALTDLHKYQTSKGLTDPQLLSISDVNGDKTTDNADLQALLNLLASGGGFISVPEPASVVLLALGGAAVGSAARRRPKRLHPDRALEKIENPSAD